MRIEFGRFSKAKAENQVIWSVQLLKFAHKSKEIEKCSPLILKVDYDSSKQKVTLTLRDMKEEKFIVKSLRVKYEFSNERIAVQCSEESGTYSLTTSNIVRHVLYNGFKCEINYSKGDQILQVLYRFEIPFFSRKKATKFFSLDSFFPNESMLNIFNYDLKKDSSMSFEEYHLLSKINEKKLSVADRLKNALHIEDLTQQKELSQYTQIDVIFKEERGEKISFQVDRSALPENIEETSLCIIPMEKYNLKKFMFNKEEDCAFVMTESFNGNNVRFVKKNVSKFNPKFNLDIKAKYAVRFVNNRITIRASINALEIINQEKLTKFFEDFEEIPRKTNVLKFKGGNFEDNFIWFNENIESNEEQKVAIKNIVNCTAFPYPYCVFGPPGTGKTSCLVECILQIMKLKPQSKILVTAQSNSACNEIGERLLKFTSIRNVFRLYSSRMQKINPGGISENLVATSNLRSLKQSEFPCVEELKHFPVIISTLTTSSLLTRASLPNHFDYIFIDESAATNEPEACIPLVGLGCKSEEITANFILIGDHKQLRPVTTSLFARDHLELGVSLMERIMTTSRYQKSPEYNPIYVTRLLNNYRSHPSILEFSNSEFYDTKLRAMNTNEEVYLGTKWHKLYNKKFPIIFHCEKEPNEKEGTSSYNNAEIQIVKQYVSELLDKGIDGQEITEKDIGIITPYKAQLQKLRKVIPAQVEIGTAEYYQGREKLIIIISTVKSRTGIGFLRDERRLNVCLTRAKALMIVVGNADTLQQDETWKRFLHFCQFNRACVGSHFMLRKLNPRTDCAVVEKKNQEVQLKVYDSEALWYMIILFLLLACGVNSWKAREKQS